MRSTHATTAKNRCPQCIISAKLFLGAKGSSLLLTLICQNKPIEEIIFGDVRAERAGTGRALFLGHPGEIRFAFPSEFNPG